MPWLPFSILQLWPFTWRIACVVDQYSRRVMGFALFKKEPKSVDIRTFLGRVVKRYGAPKYIGATRAVNSIATRTRRGAIERASHRDTRQRKVSERPL